MKRYVVFLLLIVAITGCKKSGFSTGDYLKSKLFTNDKEGTIIATVDDIPISLKEVREEMKYSLGYEYNEKDVETMIANELVQKNYEEKIINQYLIMKKLIDNKTLETEDFEKYLLIAIKETIVKYYLYKNFFDNPDNIKWKDVLITGDAEVLAFYAENKQFFDDKGVTEEDALTAIRADIEQRKQTLFMYELSQFQKNLMDDLKVHYKVDVMNN